MSRELYKIKDSLNLHDHYLWADGYYIEENMIVFFVREGYDGDRHIVRMFSLFNIFDVMTRYGKDYILGKDSGARRWAENV